MTDVNPKQVVADGYDRIAERYSAWTGTALHGPRERVVNAVKTRLPAGSAILDLGCATGVPVTRDLARTFQVTGVDLSARHIELVRANVPNATFVHGDMAALDLPDATFDAVIACYALSHVPREEHTNLLADIARWLRPSGVFAATLTTRDDPGTIEHGWLGAPMFFSGYDADTGKRMVEAAGFTILSADEITDDEDGMPVTFLWVVAEKGG